MKHDDKQNRSLEAVLTQHTPNKFDAGPRRNHVKRRFGQLFIETPSESWLDLLAWFNDKSARRFWDIETVEQCILLLEKDVQRSLEAIKIQEKGLDIAFKNLGQTSSACEDEASADSMSTNVVARLIGVFHPEYLRCAEHIFGHFISIYARVTIRKPTSGKPDLGGSVNQLNKAGLNFLTQGYSDVLRNGIAHGQVTLRANGVIYGAYSEAEETAPWDIAASFDQLWRTCNALALGILLFIQRNLQETVHSLPIGIKFLLAARSAEWQGLSVGHFSESEVYSIGRQLHVILKVSARSRVEALLEATQMAHRLLTSGITEYARYLFEIDCGLEVKGLVMINPAVLLELINSAAKPSRLKEAIEQPTLLWNDEKAFPSRLRFVSNLIKSGARFVKEEMAPILEKIEIFSGSQGFTIRSIENKSIGGIVRFEITAVITDLVDEPKSEIIQQICQWITRSMRTHLEFSSTTVLDQKRRLPGFPSYVWIKLYRRDGTLRWLHDQDFSSGNLLTLAEWHSVGRSPIFVRSPDLVDGNYRYRFSDSQVFETEEAANSDS